jgi:activating signal cointegrator 1
MSEPENNPRDDEPIDREAYEKWEREQHIMNAISLWQPWASLIADGRKKIETRHWRPPAWAVGQPLAIHATMKVDADFSRECGYDPLTIPRGCVVAIVRLDKFEKFTEAFQKEIMLYPEGRYGDFEMGRFGWFCTLIEKLNPPIAARGYQSLWKWERDPAQQPPAGQGGKG